MSVARFRYYHPLAYRRLLLAGCTVMLFGGLGSALLRHPAAASNNPYGIGLLLPHAPAAAAAAVQPATLTQLPGSDGSATPASGGVPAILATADMNARQLGQTLNAIQFGDSQWPALNSLWTRESNWNPAAQSYSGACGIPQALPCAKMNASSTAGQIQWGLNYIKYRYGTPAAAWQHEEAFGWY